MMRKRRCSGYLQSADHHRRICWLKPFFLLSLLFLCRMPAAEAVDFSPPQNLAGDGAISSAVGDLDNDGRDEFVSIASSPSGKANFRIYDLPAGDTSWKIYNVRDNAWMEGRLDRFGGDSEVADINKDGWPDIVVPESNAAESTAKVHWFQNPKGNLGGTWTIHTISTWSSVRHMCDVAVGDLDQNGRLDIVTRDIKYGCYLFLQKADGSGWYPRRFLPVNPRGGLALFDPDKDGDLDLALNGVWLETPSNAVNGDFKLHTYAAAWYPYDGQSNATLDFECQVESADFNGDGRDDIVITNAEELNDSSATSGKPDSVRVYLSPANPSGSSAWKEIILINQYFAWHSCEVGDIDNDNDPDVVTGTSNVGKGGSAPDMIVAFLNNGSGTAFTQKKIDGSLPMYNASLGDVDQDGDLDLLAPHFWSSGQIRFFENTSTAASPSTTNAAPVAAALADVTTGEIPLTVYFDGLDSYDDDGVITAYDWRFGDGGASTDASPTHTFTQPGSYQVTLTVTDDKGATDRDTLSIATQNADETFTEVDDNDGLVVWKGTWGLDHNDRYTVGAYNNTLHWSKQLGATGELTFTGTWVRLYCKTATNGNNIRVSVDGTAVETINLNGNGEQQQLVYEQTGLAYGSHTIKVECRGTYVHVDFFEYGD